MEPESCRGGGLPAIILAARGSRGVMLCFSDPSGGRPGELANHLHFAQACRR
jgi:hypothetical protein